MLKFNNSRGYRKFVNDRDAALEVILRNSRLRISEHTGEAFTNILQSIAAKYHSIMLNSSRMELDQLEGRIQMYLEHLAFLIWMELLDMRKKAFMLSYAGEAQAIAQTVGKTPKLNLSRTRLDELATKKLANDLMPMKSFGLKFNDLRRQIITRLEYSLAHGEPVDKALGRIYGVLPKQKELPAKKVLKTVKMTEANKPTFSTFQKGDDDAVDISVTRQQPVHGFEWDQETWNAAIEDLGSDYQFTDRSPENFVSMTNPWNDLPIKNNIGNEDKIYGWEIENEVVHDFVEQVRDGQVEAANKQGINDFVWIAILDDRTDDCCEWRNGLTSKEIEARLKTDKAGDDCREIVPPAHFNCRCSPAPVSDDIEAVDTSESEREFDEWLNQR